MPLPQRERLSSENWVETVAPSGLHHGSGTGGHCRQTRWVGQRYFPDFPFINAGIDKSIHPAHPPWRWMEATIKRHRIRAVIFHSHFHWHKLIDRAKASSKLGDIKPLISTLHSYCVMVQISDLALFRASLNLLAEAGFIRVCEWGFAGLAPYASVTFSHTSRNAKICVISDALRVAISSYICFQESYSSGTKVTLHLRFQ